MNAVTFLRDEYPGDDAWGRFLSVFRPAWELCQDKGRYLAKIQDNELAIVLFASMGDHAISWFDRQCGALDNRTPSDVLRSEGLGINILRTLLMRMPR